METVKIYSRAPIAHRFYNPNNGHTFILKGMNSHPLVYSETKQAHVNMLDDARTPVVNHIEKDDWEYLKATHGKNPAYFNKLNGDWWFEAENEDVAVTKADDMKPVISDEFLVSKQKGITKLAKGE